MESMIAQHLDTGATLTTETTSELEILWLTGRDVNGRVQEKDRIGPTSLHA
jgi:hypothetical protein